VAPLALGLVCGLPSMDTSFGLTTNAACGGPIIRLGLPSGS
jgi:hypothetical protein